MTRPVRSGSVRKDAHTNRSPPRTPPSQASNYKPKRGLHPRPSLRETFLDDTNPADNANNSSNDSSEERDPHDLSLSPKHAARTSIVDNMLLSLDQFALSTGSSLLDDYRLFNSVFETDLDGRNSQESAGPHRYRGHTFSSSLSSEADFAYDDSSARYATQPASAARGRRSNSSSQYHSSLGRIGSTRSREGTNSRGQLYDYRTVTGTDQTTRAMRKPSKASASSNLDFGPPLSRGTADSSGERRSASFDYGTRPAFIAADYDSTFYDSTEAAPTPSVPAGPRKLHSSAQNDIVGVLNHQSSRTPVVSRRNSIKSSRTTLVRKSRPENVGTGSIRRGPDNELSNLTDDGLDPPPAISASLDPPAPSPTISFNKPALLPPPDPTPVKERQGFFRRVFGSSRTPASGPSESIQSDSTLFQENDAKETNAAGGTLKSRRQPLRNSASGANALRESQPHVVNKKSSFFRRRKKSISMADNVPPPPIILPQELGPRPVEIMKPEPSPVSSLRKVMDSYLADGIGAACDKSNNGPIRAAGADHAENKNTGLPSARNEKENVSTAPAKGGEKSKYGLYPPPSAGSGHDTSFLMSSSGDEQSPARTTEMDAITSVDRKQETTAVEDGLNSSEGEKVGQMADDTSQIKIPTTTKSAPALSPVVESTSPASVSPLEDSEYPITEMANNSDERTTRHGQRSNSVRDHQAEPSKLFIPAVKADTSPQVSPADSGEYFTAANTPAVPSEDPKTPQIMEDPAECSDDDLSGGPSSSDRDQARRLFDSQDQVVGNEPAAAWLGGPGRASIREAYMELFDWSNMNILAALRSLCTRLVLKGETQQVDRVLDAFSTRWCQCNPRHGFKAADVVHTICYSLLLLNTDLHLADIEQKMTKTQFVRNTMPTIHRVAVDAAPDGFETIRPANRSSLSTQESGSLPARSPLNPSNNPETSNADTDRPIHPPHKLVNRLSRTDLSVKLAGDLESDVGPLVNAPFNGSMRQWEQQVETVLRDFYSSIQKQRLPLHGVASDGDGPQPQSNNLLGPGATNHSLRRSPSTISKSGSDIFPRGRSSDSRYGTARWSSKPRSRARLYPPSTMGSSRTSLDDQSSLWSPSASSTWSKYSFGKLTSASVDSFGSNYPRGDYQQSIGFANALSQAIIREDSAHSITSVEEEGTAHLLEDETLQLAGAPWAKEGNLKHKHHLDSVNKRAKDRNWNDCFAVIQQGWMRLFSFSNAAKTMRQKPKQRPHGGVVVGGGNWTENAQEIWKFLLRQTIASALPPPGYSKSRPHVWALSLPTGAVHLFQAGTPEIVREFVSSANYWSARLSKEPLVGGISNIEYGWSDAVINSALVHADNNRTPPSSGHRPSIQSSIRSSIDQQVVRPRLPADRVHISDWAPPQQSMAASTLPEEDQLKALQTYVKNVEDDLSRHNELRSAMMLAFSPRHPNAAKAMANWERKSSYLLREIVKFRTYIDSLQAAIDAKNKIYATREDDAPRDQEISQ